MNHTLQDALSNTSHSQLRQMLATLHLRRRSQDSKEAYIKLITQAWSEPDQAQQFLSALSAEAQHALTRLLALPSLPASLFWWEYGEIRGKNLTSTPATISEELYLYGILHAEDGGPIQKAKRIGIPKDLAAQLSVYIVDIFPETLRTTSQPDPLLHLHGQIPYNLLHDLLQMLLFLRALEQEQANQSAKEMAKDLAKESSPLQHNRWLAPKQLTTLRKRLLYAPYTSEENHRSKNPEELDLRNQTHKQDQWCTRLIFLAHAAGLLQNGSLTDALWPWLHQTAAQQTTQLRQAWQTAPIALRQTYHQPAAHLPSPWPQLLLPILQSVSQNSQNKTVTPQAVANHLLGSCPQFDGFFSAHFDTLTDAQKAISQTLSGPMQDLGLISPPTTWSTISPTQAASIHVDEHIDEHIDEAAEANHSWQITISGAVNPIAQAWLATIATYIRVQKSTERADTHPNQRQIEHIYQLDRNTVAAASARGISMLSMLELFTMLDITLTSAQTKQLAAWHEHGRILQLDHLPILRAQSAQYMAQIYNQPTLRAHLDPLLNPTTAQISGSTQALIESLAQASFYPQIATQPPVDQPQVPVDQIESNKNSLWLACRIYQLLGEQIPLPMPISSALLENLAQQLGTAEVQILEKEAKQIGTRIANMLDGYTVAPAPATGQDPEQWVQPLTTAIAQNEAATPGTPKQQIELQYFSAGRNQTTRRVVEPYWLEERHDIKYLRAYCHTAEDVRLFRLDRILACETVEQ